MGNCFSISRYVIAASNAARSRGARALAFIAAPALQSFAIGAR